MSVNPLAEAIISAVDPSAARRSTAAPLSSSCRTTSVLPLAAAHISGVRPRRSAASTAAPRDSSSRTLVGSPLLADSSSCAAAGAGPGVVAWLTRRPRRTTVRSMRLSPRSGGFDRLPRLECVVDTLERRRKFGMVAFQHRQHGGVLDVLDPGLGVDLGGRRIVKKEIAREPPRRHQQEDAERGLAEAEAGRQRFGVE